MSLPPKEIPLGAMRFNSDSQKLEYWNGDIWMQVHTFSPNLDGGARGVFGGGGKDPSAGNPSTNAIDYITIASAGNATDFGDLTESKLRSAAAGSRVRGYFMGGGNHPTNNRLNTIEYITFSSTGNGTDFGDLDTTTADEKSRMGGCNSATRGLCAGGLSGHSNKMWYITMTTSGTGLDFGDLNANLEQPMACSSPTRALWAGGNDGGSTHVNTIQYITTASLGNAQDFGDMTAAKSGMSGTSNSVRGLFMGGNTPTFTTGIDYITIATRGNGADFGDLPTAVGSDATGCASPIRGIQTAGGAAGANGLNVINYITIATQGDAVDFGDRVNDEKKCTGISNANGGLG